MVEGVFSRAFKSNVRPIEIGRRMVREIDTKRTLDANGRRVVPNQFLIRLSHDDHLALDDILDDLIHELETAAETYCADEGYHLRGPVVAIIKEDPKLNKGRVVIQSEVVTSRADMSVPEAPLPMPSSMPVTSPERADRLDRPEMSRPRRSLLILPNGQEIRLGTQPVVIGRLPECDVSFDDSNLSRRHAEIQFVTDSGEVLRSPDQGAAGLLPQRSGYYLLSDLGSTNGTKLNGDGIDTPTVLHAGDVITVGLYSIHFEER